ncbi:MAG: hypothetical protein GC154_01140 [bacterium]|nr:hypothetical protein [bacterium]
MWHRPILCPTWLIGFMAVLVVCTVSVFGAEGGGAPENPNPDQLDEFLKALDYAASQPDGLRKQVENALSQTNQSIQLKQNELEALQKKIELYNRALKVIQSLGKSTPDKSPQTPVPPSDETSAQQNLQKSTPATTAQLLMDHPAISNETRAAFAARFESEIWPLFNQGGMNCLTCHASAEQTPVQFGPDGEITFQHLMDRDYFNPENPSSLLAKVSAANPEVRMPPKPFDAWPESSVQAVKRFSHDFFAKAGAIDARWDERFPPNLLKPYSDQSATPAATGGNTFLTYYQLRKKIDTIFHDDWRRNERDRFAENIHLFKGADFQLRFNESSTPSASFLTGLDLLGTDVASNAYLNQSGPFEGISLPQQSPLEMDSPDNEYRSAITAIYQRMLFRNPSEAEIAAAFRMMQALYHTDESASGEDYTLSFEVTVTGDAGIPTTRSLTVDVRNRDQGLYQQAIDLNTSDERRARVQIGERFHFNANDDGQLFTLTNRDTVGHVTFHSLEIVGQGDTLTIGLNDSALKMKGPWMFRGRGDNRYLDDDDEHKGECQIEIPIAVKQDGVYEIYLNWMKDDKREYARGALAEVFSHDPSHLIHPEPPASPPAGEARFIIDQTVDTIAFWDLNTAFRFDGPEHFVEINNTGTTKRVTADAVRFTPTSGGAAADLIVDDPDADGVKDWPEFTEYSFRPYNITGDHTVNDKNERKGELAIRYSPAKNKGWKKDEFYRVGVGFPGQESNETRVPIIVHAAASSPIVPIQYPHRVPAGGEITLSAAAAYDIQGSSLAFVWKQIGGPQAKIADPHAASITFTAPAPSARQTAWEALVRALVKHPDFTFTLPPSTAQASGAAKNQLLLVKIAQDLVGRPPKSGEIGALKNGAPLSEMIDRYLASREFETFYFHRIRLYLESQGTPEEDEPARLWCYIAYHDRPFQEILTADYTVDENFEKRGRPEYYGHTGLLTMKGFIKGKPGLPHFNYPAMVAEKFLGYIFEVPPEIIDQRDGVTAAATTDPDSACYSCHKLLTPLAYQRLRWDDEGQYRIHDERGMPIDDGDQKLVASYPYPGYGMEAFAVKAQNQERFIRTIINTHFNFYFGREMRADEDERGLYHRLWLSVHENDFTIKALIKAIMTSNEYLGLETKIYETASVH